MENVKGGAAEKEETVCMVGNRINHKPPSKKKQNIIKLVVKSLNL